MPVEETISRVESTLYELLQYTTTKCEQDPKTCAELTRETCDDILRLVDCFQVRPSRVMSTSESYTDSPQITFFIESFFTSAEEGKSDHVISKLPQIVTNHLKDAGYTTMMKMLEERDNRGEVEEGTVCSYPELVRGMQSILREIRRMMIQSNQQEAMECVSS
ncbi:hypothetical protein GE061_019042 [Apolygus lucorum]|uniref:Uncharacterized protein n=1 Tax=Apolygus lucorum TaxID=248454 RepID=A0A8S9X959_APOLU|nr:hypothetical protein GE061_019042 [Apolygus lucorum]